MDIPRILRRAWIPGLWLLLWQGAALLVGEELLLPAPLPVLGRMLALLGEGDFWLTCGHSLGRILLGFLLGVLLGGLLAVLSARFPPVGAFFSPAMAAVKATPVASFIILALLWLDGGRLPLFIAFLIVFPTVYLNLLEGIRQTDRRLLEMARVFRVPVSRRLTGIYLPQALPYFRSAASLGLGLCWKAGVAAEVIGLPGGSIGERLYMAKIYFQTPDLFAWTAAIVTASLVFERLFLGLIDAAAGKAAG